MGEGDREAVERVLGCDSKTKRRGLSKHQVVCVKNVMLWRLLCIWDKLHPCTLSASLTLGTSPKGNVIKLSAKGSQPPASLLGGRTDAERSEASGGSGL